MNHSITLALSLSALALTSAALAAPEVRLTPSTSTVFVGDEFDFLLEGASFGQTAAGAVIDNFTAGQKLSFSFSNTLLELVSVTIDPRWTFAAGTKRGVIDQAAGTLTGLSFGVTPATKDDDFKIATFHVRALADGAATMSLVSGQFVGKVAGRAGTAIAAELGHAVLQVSPPVSAVPEPAGWVLFAFGLSAIGLRYRRT